MTVDPDVESLTVRVMITTILHINPNGKMKIIPNNRIDPVMMLMDEIDDDAER